MEIYSSSASFLACVDKCISEKESRMFEELTPKLNYIFMEGLVRV